MKRKTQEEFVKEVAEVSPNIEVIGNYKDSKTKLWCRCKKCGYEWEGSPTVLVRKGKGKEKKGGGCPKCAGVMAKTHKEFMTECQRKNPKIEIISEYKGANKEITCRCKKCGLEWKTTPHVLLSKAESKCPNEAENRRKTTEEFRTEMKLINPSIEIIGEYINAKTAIECHCKLCGHEWISTPDNLRGAKGCPVCINTKLHKERYMGQAEFERRLQKCNPDINVLGTYINTATRIQVQCKKCGHHWSPYAGNLLRGYGCSKCAGNRKISKSEFMRGMRKYPEIEVIGDYVNGTVKIKVRCRKCGKEWETQPISLMRSKGCKYCRSRHVSSQEEFIAVSLERLYGKGAIIRHNIDIIGKELDIFIKKENIAVEVGDWNYHEKRYLNDKRKKELCEEKGIRLITLYFNVKNKSQRYNEKDIFFFKDNLQDIKGKQKAAVEIIQAMGKEINYSQLIWEKINEISLRKAGRKDPEEYARELKKLQPDFELLSEYANSKLKVHVKCKRCGYEWWADPYRLKKLKYCPGEHPKITKEMIAIKAAEAAPSIEVLEEYQNWNKKIKCRCKDCGEEFYRIPQSILIGYKCAKCSKVAKKTQRQFIEEMKKVNPQIKILGEYQTATTPIKCECITCGFEWSPTPDSLLHHHGCPDCAGNRRKTHDEFLVEMEKSHPKIKIIGKYTKRKSKIRCCCRECGAEFEKWVDVLYNLKKCPVCMCRL